MTGAAAPIDLDLLLPPQEGRALLRLPALAVHRAGRSRSQALDLIWHDTADGVLAASGRALCERRSGRTRTWELVPLYAVVAGTWPTPLATAARPDALPVPPLAGLLPIAAASVTMRIVPLGPEAGAAALSLLEGRLRAVTEERPFCRVRLHDVRTPTLALALAAALPLYPAAETLAATALALVGRAPSLPTPSLTPDLSVGAAFAALVARQAEILLRLAPVAVVGEGTEPVHQMRVALRRLRSAVTLFRRTVDCPVVQEIKSDLKNLSQVLAPARDWDVLADSTLAAVTAAFPEDRALARLRAAVARKRAESYGALRTHLEGPAFRALGLRLIWASAVRPWEAPDDEAAAAALAEPLTAFAARALSRRLARVLAHGDDLTVLSPEALHDLRLECKRLRYAAEFFAPLFPSRGARRFIRRVGRVQDRLGQMNDATVAAQLLNEVGAAGRGYVAGLVRGFLAARRPRTAAKAARAWARLCEADPFWL